MCLPSVTLMHLLISSPLSKSPHYTGVYLICIWIISQTSAWLWQALMTENCRRSKETHSFAPEQLAAAAAVCLSDLSHFTTHIHQQSLALLCIYHHKTTWECVGCWPNSAESSFGLGFWVQPLGGRVLWLRDLALFGNLSSSLLPLFAFSRSLSLSHTLTEHNYLSLSLFGYRFRIKNTRGYPQFMSSLDLIYILFDIYALILVLINWHNTSVYGCYAYVRFIVLFTYSFMECFLI